MLNLNVRKKSVADYTTNSKLNVELNNRTISKFDSQPVAFVENNLTDNVNHTAYQRDDFDNTSGFGMLNTPNKQNIYINYKYD